MNLLLSSYLSPRIEIVLLERLSLPNEPNDFRMAGRPILLLLLLTFTFTYDKLHILYKIMHFKIISSINRLEMNHQFLSKLCGVDNLSHPTVKIIFLKTVFLKLIVIMVEAPLTLLEALNYRHNFYTILFY